MTKKEELKKAESKGFVQGVDPHDLRLIAYAYGAGLRLHRRKPKESGDE